MNRYFKFGLPIAAILGILAWLGFGSIGREGSNTVFLLAENQWKQDVGDDLRVVYSGRDPLPDTFREHAQALVDGKLGADGAFHADKVQAKVH